MVPSSGTEICAKLDKIFKESVTPLEANEFLQNKLQEALTEREEMAIELKSQVIIYKEKAKHYKIQQQLRVTQPLEGCEVLRTRRSPEFCRVAGATCSRPCCAGRGCGSKPRRSTMRPFRERSVLRQPCCSPACFRPLGTAMAGDAR